MNRTARVIRDLFLTALIFLFLGLVVVRLDVRNSEAPSGQARVVDGDTLVMGGQRIRLVGIDAPELRQVCERDGQPWACGRAAKDHLEALIGEDRAACAADGSDRYGRLLAICLIRDLDLNAAMVGSGYAVAFGAYEAEEEMAKRNRLGLWAGTFDAPHTWRRTHGGMDELPHMPTGTLRIMLSRLGDWIAGIWND
ncbi:MAG TPA: thermonuclease family protein [Pararhizobium sp.]|uniref:thermonuclease family protein n=1 Tax=Pararhizobium sp. TaxID=1977563 RepID=UPI002C75A4B7|nr:thermonuclease family protein [Pararhizobium sp.]HTO32485.1 thermonuclease family protein [Pararhizobium sp.]